MLPSTADQTLAHQRSQAEAVGFQIDEVIADRGYPASALGCANSLKGDTASYRPDLVYRYCRAVVIVAQVVMLIAARL